jgi:large subunit ribosomal protein L3
VLLFKESEQNVDISLTNKNKMTDNNGIRSGSLQFYPRVRAKKVIPSANWKPIKKDGNGLQGFIGYKVGMVSVFAKDNTPDSLTKGKRITFPATVIECPKMKIYSVRFYKDGKVSSETVVANDKFLKRKLRVPTAIKELSAENDFDDVRVIVYSLVKNTGIGKKKPDVLEMALSGSSEEKMSWIKENLKNEISVKDIFGSGLVDIRAVTKAYGTNGPVKRFGISLKASKSEKGQRRPGSLAPWHPARVTFRAPQAGQTGFHNRITYNNAIVQVGSIEENNINPKRGFHRYGNVKNDFMVLAGSIPGPKKRGLLISAPLRPTKKQSKKNYEVLELR